VDGDAIGGTHFLPPTSPILMLGNVACEASHHYHCSDL
jgi:hypothetical protein